MSNVPSSFSAVSDGEALPNFRQCETADWRMAIIPKSKRLPEMGIDELFENPLGPFHGALHSRKRLEYELRGKTPGSSVNQASGG
jgi:hypothetical protein